MIDNFPKCVYTPWDTADPFCDINTIYLLGSGENLYFYIIIKSQNNSLAIV